MEKTETTENPGILNQNQASPCGYLLLFGLNYIGPSLPRFHITQLLGIKAQLDSRVVFLSRHQTPLLLWILQEFVCYGPRSHRGD